MDSTQWLKDGIVAAGRYQCNSKKHNLNVINCIELNSKKERIRNIFHAIESISVEWEFV